MNATPISSQPQPPALACINGRPSRLDLVLQVRKLCRQGVGFPVETVLSRYPGLVEQQSIVFDLVFEEYHQRCQSGRTSDPDDFAKRFSAWGLNIEDVQAAKLLLDHHGDLLTGPPDAWWPEPDKPLLNFDLVGELGRGSFARVYLALEPALGHRPVVLKVSSDGAAEANTLGQLDHPNIVPVYSVHHEPNRRLTVVCMPYLGSATLDDVRKALRLRQLPPSGAEIILDSIQDRVAPELLAAEKKNPPAWLRRGSYVNGILHIGQQLAQALAFVHEKGIYHRDLKPSNVLMTADGRPMLLDFNLSRHKRVSDQQAAGTLVYMPPEQLAAIHPENRNNSPILIDERSDVFSLGVILYELLTGAYPFGPIPRQESLKVTGVCWFERQKAGPQPLRKRNPRVDSAAARIIESCLAFNPKDRPHSADALAAALGRQLCFSRRVGRWASLHVPLVLVSTVLAFAALGVGAYLVIPKEPYGVRQLHLGWERYHQGRYQEAIDSLCEAVAADATSIDARLGRARAYLRLGRFGPALADFQAADELAERKDGRIKAAIGYCFNLLKLEQDAMVRYREARDLGFETAEVLNNLGYSYIMWNTPLTKPDDCLDRAEECLTMAINLNDRLQPAYYNRARLAILRAGRDPRRIPDQGLADIQKAIELGPVTAPLLWDASRLSWLAAGNNPRQAAKTLDYLNEAVDCGLNPKSLEDDFIFHDLKKDHRFQALIRRPHLANQFRNAQKLVDPILD